MENQIFSILSLPISLNRINIMLMYVFNCIYTMISLILIDSMVKYLLISYSNTFYSHYTQIYIISSSASNFIMNNEPMALLMLNIKDL